MEIGAAIHSVHRRGLTRPSGDGVYETTYQEISIPNPLINGPSSAGLHEIEGSYLPKNTISFHPHSRFRALSPAEYREREVDSNIAHSASQR